MQKFNFLFALLLVFSPFSFADNRPIQVTALQTAAIATSTSPSIKPWGAKRTFYANGTTSAGVGAATILIEVSDVDSASNGDWITAATITLTLGTTTTSDGFASDAAWRFVRSRITAISGTDATVNIYVGAE